MSQLGVRRAKVAYDAVSVQLQRTLPWLSATDRDDIIRIIVEAGNGFDVDWQSGKFTITLMSKSE